MNHRTMLLLCNSNRRHNRQHWMMYLSSHNSSRYFFKITFLYIISFVALIMFSCGQNNNEPKNDKFPSANSTIFYPVREYFLSQIKSVDSSMPRIRMVTTINGQKDSTAINIEQFNKIAQTFLENNIADTSVKKYYRQSIFQDMTTGSYTFNYTSVNSSLPVQNLNVLLDTTTQTVKRVFVSKIKINGDSTITEKLSWKNDNSFLIHRTIQLPQKKEITEQISVVWRDNN
jgi:hypothetical protein